MGHLEAVYLKSSSGMFYVFYAANLPSKLSNLEIYDFFSIDSTVSSIFLNEIPPEDTSEIRDGWFLVKEGGRKYEQKKTVKINGKDLNMRLMGYLFPNEKSKTKPST